MLCKNCIKISAYLTNLKIIKSSIPDFSRLYSSLSNENLTEWFNVKSKFTEEQLVLILKTLNKCNLKEMKKLNMAEDHIKIFESLKKEKQPSKTLDDLIIHNTLKVSELENICSTICSKQNQKSNSSLVSPTIKIKDLENIKTAVGLRVGFNHISWSQLELTGSHCNILKWDCQTISDLPLNASPAKVIEMGINAAEKIPIADAYIMEKDGSKPLSSINISTYRLLLRHQQLVAIVLTALSTKYKSAHSSESPSKDIFSIFYMMKAHAPAKLFHLFFGSETVSTSNTVKSLFDQKDIGLKNVLSLSSEGEMAALYESLNFYQQEEINKSLLLTITFFELAVLQARNDHYKKKNKNC